MAIRLNGAFLCATAAAVMLALLAQSARAADELNIEGLLKGGWVIAGFTTMFDNRSAMILFRHPNEMYLVQCRTGLDVTRKPPVYANCYELR